MIQIKKKDINEGLGTALATAVPALRTTFPYRTSQLNPPNPKPVSAVWGNTPFTQKVASKPPQTTDPYEHTKWMSDAADRLKVLQARRGFFHPPPVDFKHLMGWGGNKYANERNALQQGIHGVATHYKDQSDIIKALNVANEMQLRAQERWEQLHGKQHGGVALQPHVSKRLGRPKDIPIASAGEVAQGIAQDKAKTLALLTGTAPVNPASYSKGRPRGATRGGARGFKMPSVSSASHVSPPVHFPHATKGHIDTGTPPKTKGKGKGKGKGKELKGEAPKQPHEHPIKHAPTYANPALWREEFIDFKHFLLLETLPASASVKDYIDDFQASDDPRFTHDPKDSKAQRRKRAIAAAMKAKRKSKKRLNEGLLGAVEPLIGEGRKKLKNIINKRKNKKKTESGPDLPMDYSAGKRDTPQNI